MVSDDDFTIISVNSDDDEVVIQAGVTQVSDMPDSTVGIETVAVEEATVSVADDVAQVADEVDNAVGTSTQSLESRAQNHASADKIPQGTTVHATSTEEYHETTVEDLEEIGPLPKTRIVIIVAGLLLIIGFILYYLFLR